MATRNPPDHGAQPFQLQQKVVVEARNADGTLRLGPGVEPPPRRIVPFEEVYRWFWQENPNGGTLSTFHNRIGPEPFSRSASWGDLRAWLETKGWGLRAKTW